MEIDQLGAALTDESIPGGHLVSTGVFTTATAASSAGCRTESRRSRRANGRKGRCHASGHGLCPGDIALERRLGRAGCFAAQVHVAYGCLNGCLDARQVRVEVRGNLRDTAGSILLRLLQRLEVGHHGLQVSIGGLGHTGYGVHRIRGAIHKGSDHVPQTLYVATTGGKAGQVRVVIVPILRLFGHGCVHVIHAVDGLIRDLLDILLICP